MDIVITVLFLGMGFISFSQVKNLLKYKNDNRYKCLKYLVFSTFLWSIIIILERMIQNVQLVYYLNLSTYPLKMILSGFMLCTIVSYLDKKLSKIIIVVIVLSVIGDIVLVGLNNSTHWMLSVDSTVSDKLDIWSASKGLGFYIHALAVYTVLMGGIIYLYRVVIKSDNKSYYAEVTKALFLSTIFVVITSLIQIVFNIPYDVVFIAMVVLINNLYNVIYQNDMLFNLRTSGRVKILSNMREMYVITDQNESIVEVSHLLLEQFNLTEEELLNTSLDDLFHKLEEDVVFHSSIGVGEELANIGKRHYHIKKKKFRLEGMEVFGYMVLLYDESQVVELLRELNRLSNFDDMTGLHNRNYIEGVLEGFDHKDNVAVLSLDLNGLKTNNDYIGHDRGDYLLKALADVIREKAPLNAISARIGGDEFIIILENTDASSVLKLKEEIMNACFDEDIMKRVSVSIGTSIKTKDETIYQLITNADKAMYDEKRNVSHGYSEELMKTINAKGFIR